MNALIKPKALKSGGKIGVCSPGWFIAKEKLQLSAEKWRSLGYDIFLHPQTEERDADMAGDPKNRASALHDLFLDNTIDAIFFSVGGYGCVQMLEFLDFDLIKKHPKIVVGYSDITILLLAIYAKTGLITFNGPQFYDLPDKFWHPETINSLQEVLSGKTPSYQLDQFSPAPKVIRSGKATGPLLGGNHVRMKDLIGTEWMPRMSDCFFFTESNRPSYPTIDGDMYHLRYSNSLNNPKAILLGSMEIVNSDNPKYNDLQYNLELDTMIPKHFPNIPIVSDLPFSHSRPDFITFPIGIDFELDAQENKCRLTQIEPAVEI